MLDLAYSVSLERSVSARKLIVLPPYPNRIIALLDGKEGLLAQINTVGDFLRTV